jgi:hypothetical protein
VGDEGRVPVGVTCVLMEAEVADEVELKAVEAS